MEGRGTSEADKPDEPSVLYAPVLLSNQHMAAAESAVGTVRTAPWRTSAVPLSILVLLLIDKGGAGVC